jgi:hypothetical protein
MILTHLILFGFFPGAGGEIAPIESAFPDSNSGKPKRYKEREKKNHSSIYTIQEKANSELVKLYEKTPKVLEESAPIEISIPAHKTKPSVVLVTAPLLPPPEDLKPIAPLSIAPQLEPEIKGRVIEQTISIPDEMDDEEAVDAILALIHAGVL